MEEKRRVLSILVKNNPGVLNRIAGLFSRRGYNIDSLSVGKTEDENLSRMTVVVYANYDMTLQIKNQVNKLQEVIKVEDLKPLESVFRELVLLKIDSNNKNRSSIIEIANIFRANIIDISTDSLTVEITGDESKIEAIIKMLNPFGLKEIIRTGLIALHRGEKELKDEREN